MLQRFQIPLLMAGLLYSSLVSNQALEAIEPPVKSGKEKTDSSSQQTDSEFVQSQAELKKLIGELTALQAEYQQPNADKASIENKFNITRDKAREAALALEQSASAAVLANPENTDACAVVRDVLQAAIQADDPKKALRLVNTLNDAGKANEDVLLNGATAAMITSELDLAEKFLKAAEEAGMSPDKITSLQEAIEAERPKVATEMATRAAEEKADDLPQVKIETTKGTIVVELFENEAPNTVANFISLVENQFYNGTPFHRVIPQFMAQGGDPTGTGTSGPGYTIECECDLPNARKHFLGSLSMAHAGKDTGGSQFFLTFRPTEHLDGRHTVFGRVIEGFDVLPKITRTEGPQARPTQDKIISAEILRKRDHAYEPKTSKKS
ncbi:MAG: peptidylprolyl isomerase [Pirellulales bacterium]|nr:peptidylprolyl isomerase [Pirellulales bacterium]MDA7993955.1 peptidylprolyl isomerase [Pirellulales bacterium]